MRPSLLEAQSRIGRDRYSSLPTIYYMRSCNRQALLPPLPLPLICSGTRKQESLVGPPSRRRSEAPSFHTLLPVGTDQADLDVSANFLQGFKGAFVGTRRNERM